MRVEAITRPVAGESESGDGYFVAVSNRNGELKDPVLSSVNDKSSTEIVGGIDIEEEDTALLAIVDGLGHGPEAAAATRKIIDCLRRSWHFDLVSLVMECHTAAAHSRGAALGVVRLSLSGAQACFVGVGNVRMQMATLDKTDSHDATESEKEDVGPSAWRHHLIPNYNGTVGYSMPSKLQSQLCTIPPGLLLLFCSDGVRQALTTKDLLQAYAVRPKTDIRVLMDEFGHRRDDATIIIAK